MSVQINNLSFRYMGSKEPVFTNISCTFHRQCITAITGANGCGKTTLSMVVLGMLRPMEGSVLIDEQDASKLSIADKGLMIGYVMQNPSNQIFKSSVAEEIEFGLNNMKLSEGEIVRRRDYFLNYFDLSDQRDKLPFKLSQGEKQRLILAAVLAMHPRYLMLDEPTASLDGYRKCLLGEYLLKVKEDMGCGIIIISHDEDFVEDFADRVIDFEELKRGGSTIA